MASVLFVIAEHCYEIVYPSAYENQTPYDILKEKLTQFIVAVGRAPTQQSCLRRCRCNETFYCIIY